MKKGRTIIVDDFKIQKAEYDDLSEILQLQYLAYQSEAELLGNKDIPPLKQTLNEIISEYNDGIILKIENKGAIIGSVRAVLKNDTVYIGKLMVHPDFRRRGLGKKLLSEIESYFLNKRYELFTSTRSKDNIRLYESLGYRPFDEKKIDDKLIFVYLEKK